MLRQDWNKYLGVILQAALMEGHFNSPIRPDTLHLQIDQIISRQIGLLSSRWINRSSANSDIIIRHNGSLLMFVTKQMERSPTSERIIHCLSVDEPVDRMVYQNHICSVRSGVENCLPRSHIKRALRIIFTVSARQQRRGQPMNT